MGHTCCYGEKSAKMPFHTAHQWHLLQNLGVAAMLGIEPQCEVRIIFIFARARVMMRAMIIVINRKG